MSKCYVESWHNSLNRSVAIQHANLWRFIKKLQDQQDSFEAKYLIIESGREPTRILKKYDQINKALSRLHYEYVNSNLPLLEYLDKIKYFIGLLIINNSRLIIVRQRSSISTKK